MRAHLALPLRIAHYRPYTSKWHPIEHPLFSQVERALRGVMLDRPQTALTAIQRVSTQTGLSVVARILGRISDIGRKAPIRFATSRTNSSAMMPSWGKGTISSTAAALIQRPHKRSSRLISRQLNHFDLVLLQEDFAYSKRLASEAKHPYSSAPHKPYGALLNDGLTLLSTYPFRNFARNRWKRCHGVIDSANDCLAAKGFSVAALELAPGVELDVYNFQMDAGSAVEDLNARKAQADQLVDVLNSRSHSRPIILGGDTNLKHRHGAPNLLLERLLRQGRLRDACRVVGCGDERIDRVFYRSSSSVALEALS